MEHDGPREHTDDRSYSLALAANDSTTAMFAAGPAVGRIVPASTTILPDENLQRKVDGATGSGQHEKRSCFGLGLPKMTSSMGTHLQAHRPRFTGMDNDRKEGHSTTTGCVGAQLRNSVAVKRELWQSR
jgi:hypothetical protein